MTINKQRIFMETYGCQMNVYDTELVKRILTDHNYEFTKEERSADVVLLNTCSVRENANRKVYQRVHELRAHSTVNELKIGILGCMATNFRKKLLDNSSLKIDFIAGPDSYKQLPNLIQQSTHDNQKAFHVTLSEFETYSDVYPMREESVNAWIAVMRGCNNYCTFCVVPHTRGRERSRDPQNVIQEVERLVEEGYTQVTLLGQNVNSYRYDNYDFADLMKMVSEVPGIRRIRYTSPHPKDFPVKFLKTMAENPKICNQIHMPLQAGNTRVLDKMNRTYTKEEFLDLAKLAKEMVPNVTLTTDIIVGFPSETPEEFEDTLDVVRQVQFDSAFMFKYSERKNTIASKRFPDDVTEAEKTRRIVELVNLQQSISLLKNKQEIGNVQEVLIEQVGTKKSPTQIKARNEGNKIIILEDGNCSVGSYYDVEIIGATSTTLMGKLVSEKRQL